MKVVWAIASYKRADRQPWLEQLVEWGYGPDDIVLSTQTQEDYEAYAARYGHLATVIYKPGTCVSDNKNTAIEHAAVMHPDRQIVSCADKLRGVMKLSKDGKSLTGIDSRQGMEKVLEHMVEMRDRAQAEVAGVYSVGNAFYMSHTVHVNQQMLGCFMVFKPGTQWRFDRFCRLKEDFELIMRIIQGGGRVLRLNYLALKETLHTQGGCYEMWSSEGDRVNAECTNYILNKYPELVKPHATRKNEIRYVGPSKCIKIK